MSICRTIDRICRSAVFLVICGVLCVACRDKETGIPAGTPNLPKVRNLLVVCIDTLRADHLTSYGYPRQTSPRIGSLAAEGVLFQRAFAHSNWTVPATASLLTSLLPSEHGAGVAGEIKNLDATPPLQLREDVRTLGQILEEAGFRTGLFSANPFLYGRFKRGFDMAEVGRQNATVLNDKAISWLREQPTEPFFLYVQYMDLHQPIEPPDPYFHLFESAEGGQRGDQHKEWRYGQHSDWEAADFRRFKAHKIALYDGALRYVDDELARLLDTIEELAGTLSETLVVITSDHGEEFWEHADVQRELGGDVRGVWGIGHGHSMFQELLHVPLIFWGPGIRADRRVECDVGHVDVVPTLLELLGLDSPAEARGQSLARFVAGDGSQPCPDVPIVAESPAYGPDSRAVIWRRHKLIERKDGVTLLYDLRDDQDERHDLAADSPDQVAGMRALLGRITDPDAQRGEDEAMEFDPETREQLRALGYLK